MKRSTLTWLGLVTLHDLSREILQGTVDGGRRRGKQRPSWNDNVKEWTGCGISTRVRVAENRQWWCDLIVDADIVTPNDPGPGFGDEWMSMSDATPLPTSTALYEWDHVYSYTSSSPKYLRLLCLIL